MKQNIVLFSIIASLLIGFSSCNNNKDIIPSAEFAPYISAYTGGVIASNSSIFIELTQEQGAVEAGAEIEEKLFKFSPSLKGKAYWVNSKTIEFVPEPDALKPGTLYNASFALSKVMDVDKKLSKFEFSFRVQERNFAVEIMSLDVYEDSPNKVTVRGDIRLSETADMETLSKMITANRDKDNFTPKLTATDNPLVYYFVIANIAKKDKDTYLNVTVSGAKLDIDKVEKKEVLIPALKPFKLINYEVIEQPEHGICLTFSDPVSKNQDLEGLIVLDGVKDYIYQIQDNKINLYFERNHEKAEIEVHINRGVRNMHDDKLTQNYVVSVEEKVLPPQIEISTSGTIMPNSKNLIVPFRAVSLRAVELKIIRIYESNILMFLQENSLSSSSELKRSGRLIYKKVLRLDTDPTKKINQWEDYAIDLSQIIKQEPGAIYRVILSFKQEHAAYPCGEESSLTESLTTFGENEMTEEDEALWDKPQSYYYDYDSDWDWEYYEWSERNNPCHPTYYMNSNRTTASVNVLASNLGVIVKANSAKKLWISVADLLEAKPVSNADVVAYNYQLQIVGTAKTDANGFAEIEAKQTPFFVVAISCDQKAYVRLADGEENMLTRFDVGGKEIKKGLKGYIYGERGVWRPGDTLFLSFMLRDYDKKIPANHPVTIEVYNPRGQFHYKQISTNGLNGLYTFAVPTKDSDPTGLWNAYVKIGGTSFHKSLRIETIKPNRLKITMNISGKQLQATESQIPVSIHSVWLTGATARNLKTSVEMTLSKTTTQFKGYGNYIFNNPAADFSTTTIDVYNGTLNEEGKATFNMRMPRAKDAPGMLRANIVCNVYEKGGDVSIYNQTIPFSPFSSYVGINFNQRDKHTAFETDVDNVFDVVTLTPDGKPTNRNLEYKVYRVGWSWWWENDNSSFSSYLQNSSITPVSSGTVKTVNGKGQIKLKINYPEWGRYLVYVVDRESGHATGGTVFIDWPSWRGRSNKSDPSGIKMLAFSTDKSSYEVGEEVKVTIPSAAGGRALVALENGSKVVSREWVSVSSEGDTKYSFKVTQDMAPNVYIHISLLQPHEQSVNDLPIRMYGVVPIFVADKSSKLAPKITMPDVLRPETEFTVKVKETTGKPMTYTLAVVDEGLLDLTNFKTPDPWNEFYSREALGIRTWDMYDHVIGAFAGKYGSLFSIGGDEGIGSGNSKASRFTPVVRFIGPFELKKGEEKSHKLKLPPYIGSVRVMVVAGQDGAYGCAEKTVAVKTPLMVLASLPRVVSTDEQIALPVTLFALENTVKSATVKVETTGKLKLADNNNKTVNFPTTGDQMVYFTLKSGTQTGVETITVTATGGGKTSQQKIEIDVRNPNPPVVQIQNQLLNPSETGDFTYQVSGAHNENWVKLEVSRIPSVDISRRFDFLYDYQHNCSEQLTSKALPLLFVSQFKDMDSKESEQIKNNVRTAISNLYGRQLSNGGIVYWPGDGHANEWITSYAGVFLILAKEKSYQVNEGVLKRWTNYQRKAAQSWKNENAQHGRYYYRQSDLEQAYRLYSLALAGSPEMGAMNRMKEMSGLSVQSKWMLAAAYALAGKTKAAQEIVFNMSQSISPYSLSNSTYGSSDRDEAMILEALVLMGKDKEAFVQAQKVSANLSNESYFTTQSTAYALMAMGRLAEKMSGAIDCEWTLNGVSQSAIKSAKAIVQKDIPLKSLSGKISIKNRGKGVLYVNVVSKTKPIRDTLPPVQNNIRLEVSYTDKDGRPIDISQLRQGSDFMATLKVSNIAGVNNYTDMELTHIISSGWEIYNERMLNPDEDNSGRGAYIYQDIRDDRVLTYFDLGRNQTKTFKIRLMASYAGSFVLPAIQCSAMYDVSVQARTSAGRVSVVQ